MARCIEGCACKRHRHPGCAAGCTCAKHTSRNSGQFGSRLTGRAAGGGAKIGWKGTVDERFEAKVAYEPMSGCFLWTGAVGTNGYGYIKIDGRAVAAHAYADDRERGPLPPGLTRDHLCRVQTCVNPAHLERVTRAENSRREMAARMADKTRKVNA